MPIKSIKVDNKLPEDYEPHEIKDANSARAASIHLLFSHVADFHKLIVKIIAEKYKIKEEEIYDTIVKHPDYTGMTINPFIYGLSYVTQEDADKALSEMEEVKEEVKEEVVKNEVIEPTVAKKAVRKKKVEVVPVEAPSEAPVQEPVQQKLKVIRKKKAAE